MPGDFKIYLFERGTAAPKELDDFPNQIEANDFLWINASKVNIEVEQYFYENETIDINAVAFLFQEKKISELDFGDDYFTIATSGYHSTPDYFSIKEYRFRIFVNEEHVVMLNDIGFMGLEDMNIVMTKDRSLKSTSSLFAWLLEIIVRNQRLQISHIVNKYDTLLNQSAKLENRFQGYEFEELENENKKTLAILRQLNQDSQSILSAKYKWVDPESAHLIANSVARLTKIEENFAPKMAKKKSKFFGRFIH
ncbi:MAG: hypothetical protein HKO02_06615 [Hyphomonadaceae bacterium]|nr:hypothetical protein [Hyphomonadaceae bacterium]